MTIGELITQLRLCKQNAEVVWDFPGDHFIGRIESYRVTGVADDISLIRLQIEFQP